MLNAPFNNDTPLYLTDGGIETTLIFHNGFDLTEFAAFPLLETVEGTAALRAYYETYIRIALASGTGFVLETPTWRASPKWARLLGYSDAQLHQLNTQAVELMQGLRAEFQTDRSPMLVSGCIGPESDGYQPADRMTVAQASSYHGVQARSFKAAGVDMLTAITMTYPEEAIGICNAAADVDLPVAVAFTVETDGRLPIATTLADAIQQVDAEAVRAPAYYMINCAHPDHFHLPTDATWLSRIGGVRANASRMSHAELDESETLDDGDPEEFGVLHRSLRKTLPGLRVIGGCCGTDHRHVGAVVDLA